MMNPHRNTSRRRRGRSHDARLEELEELMAPADPGPSDSEAGFWTLYQWARTAGGEVAERAHVISGPYADAANELVRIISEAGDAGEIIPGDRFPSLLTGEVRFSPERQARFDAYCRTMDDLTEQLRQLKRDELARRRARQAERP